MQLSPLTLTLSMLLLAGCSRPEAEPAAPPTAADTAPVADASPTPAVPAPVAAAGAAAAPTGEDAQASFSGYGDVKFGIAAADMEKAWGGDLTERGMADNASCYFMTPAWVKTPSEFNFLVGDGKFTRFGTESAKYVAPGGGKIGMTKAEITALYAGRIEQQPHKYTDGQYLRIKDSAGGNGVLIFETDAKGDAAKVTEWRVGVPPQVDYVEGCS